MKLGVNIDHVATIRQARGTAYPDLLEAVREAERGGADAITLHLREDRRHIQDHDVVSIREIVTTRMNLEMAATDEMVKIAAKVGPEDCCLVPERREELTTEGGLDVLGQCARLKSVCRALHDEGIRVSLFIEPEIAHIDEVLEIGAPVIELHTGSYANCTTEDARRAELMRITRAVEHAAENGLCVNAGHGLDYINTQDVAAIPQLAELNIGHSIVSRALFVGLREAVHEMKQLIAGAR